MSSRARRALTRWQTWLRERALAVSTPFVPPPPPDPDAVGRSVEEGLLIARSALAMGVRNRIVVSVIREDRVFDPQEVADIVKSELLALAAEYTREAVRLERTAVRAISARGPKGSGHDYRPDDYGPLIARGAVYAGLARELELLSEDEAFLAAEAESARTRAWEELGAAIEGRLDRAAGPINDPDYAEHREERMRALREIDLVALARKKR